MMPEDHSDVASLYDQLDAFYRHSLRGRTRHLLHGGGQGDLHETVAGLLDVREGEAVCDVGCGYGDLAVRLANQSGVSVTGVTISARQVEHSVATGIPGVLIVHADWLANGLPDESFDGLVAVESLSHMKSPAEAVAEMARVLRPGGRAVLSCWLRSSETSLTEDRLLLEPVIRAGRLHGMGTEAGLRNALGVAGLEITRTLDVSGHVRSTWPACFRAGLRAALDRRVRPVLLAKPLQAANLGIAALCSWAAFGNGAMRYLILKVRKPG